MVPNELERKPKCPPKRQPKCQPKLLSQLDLQHVLMEPASEYAEIAREIPAKNPDIAQQMMEHLMARLGEPIRLGTFQQKVTQADEVQVRPEVEREEQVQREEAPTVTTTREPLQANSIKMERETQPKPILPSFADILAQQRTSHSSLKQGHLPIGKLKLMPKKEIGFPFEPSPN